MPNSLTPVTVIGGGLAGCEAALVLAGRGVPVTLYEQKPLAFSPAHSDENLCELVCSNSLKSDDASTAGGTLKAELRRLDSPLLRHAERCRVPAGSALAVDRKHFAASVTDAVGHHPLIERRAAVIDDWDTDGYTVIATGPLTAEPLMRRITQRSGSALHFYDAAAPIVSGACIDRACCFTADRYGRGEGDYVNCPMDKEQYLAFVASLLAAERAELHAFEKSEIFEGCMPVEVMAARGVDTLRFGPMRPVGFFDDKGQRPYAVLQLRRENAAGDMYNLVGFQTNLKFQEQRRVFSMIPALKNIEILRYGVMHRNSYVNAPEVLDEFFRLKAYPRTFIAGQLSGVEGYVESIMSGHLSARHLLRMLSGAEPVPFPPQTILGALPNYLATPNAHFQPMNANFGILPPILQKFKDKRLKKAEYAARSLLELENFLSAVQL